jgi:hypothetical protein
MQCPESHTDIPLNMFGASIGTNAVDTARQVHQLRIADTVSWIEFEKAGQSAHQQTSRTRNLSREASRSPTIAPSTSTHACALNGNF